MEGNSSVAAIVVTYERDDKLRACLDALGTSRVDAIFLIDNAAQESTAQIASQTHHPNKIRYLPQAENLGGAGGFSQGLIAAQDEGHDFYWLMDDDCISNSTSLDHLLRAFEEASNQGVQPAFVASKVVWTDGEDHLMNTPPICPKGFRLTAPEIVEIRSASFVSLLLPSQIIAKAGLPISEFFIWYDDTEYTLRLRRFGAGLLARDSIVVHATEANEAGSFKFLTEKNSWKYQRALPNLFATMLASREYALLVRSLASVGLGLLASRASLKTKIQVVLSLRRLRPLLERTRREW